MSASNSFPNIVCREIDRERDRQTETETERERETDTETLPMLFWAAVYEKELSEQL